ncbi:MAG: 4-alpha-glucanotransferase [Candidatus Eremiobacteraeota bacterium]|nr:4-alpha-glucanotransferase [Candidatus Eremiobacteraeota bacterium]
MSEGGRARLAALAGIEPSFRDYFGNETLVGDATNSALLEAMGYDLSSERSIAAAIAAVEEEALRPAVVVLTIPSHAEGRVPPSATIVLESGEPYTGDVAELPLGYHHLTDGSRSATLIVAPARCYLPPEMERGRVWGLATQLYALTSVRNWGIGDFTDLAHFAEAAGNAGARAIALNPLHELYPNDPAACSPYSPSSRLWLSALYLDVTSVPEFAESETARGLAGAAAADLGRLRAVELVDYEGVARAKRPILEALFASFSVNHLQRPGDRRAAQFREFVRAGGASLEDLARYEALAEYLHSADERHYGWLQWPQEYRSPRSAAVERFARERRERVDFYLYLQWLADRQLAGAAAVAQNAGVGFYRDLAVGVGRNGADAWSNRATILDDVSLGAPPDALNAHGQEWGLPPLSPAALRRSGYAPLAELLRANMRHATMLRIDHAMSLQRTFWIPLGKHPRDGAYVHGFFDEMLAVVALESVRNQCVIVGEDLGTVPEGFRERMLAAQTLSSRLVYFERTWDGEFMPAPEYPHLAAASIGTHDLPPLGAWWTGADVALRAEIGLYSEAGAREAADERRRAREQLIAALEREGAADAATVAYLREDASRGGTPAAVALLANAVHRFLAKTPAALVVVALDDVLAEMDAVNVPGTVEQHPNWRRKHLRTLEEIEGLKLLAATGEIFRT